MYYCLWQNEKLNFVALILNLSSKLIPCPNIPQHSSTNYCHPDPTPALAIYFLSKIP
jgi:hypothetical protein